MKTPQRQRDEAVAAADAALGHLESAYDTLRSAGRWSLFDILGGDLFAALVKHGELDKVNTELDAARDALRVFVQEVRDVDQGSALRVELGDFLTFADFFFDDPFSDLMVHARINDLKGEIENAIVQVRSVRERLLRLA